MQCIGICGAENLHIHCSTGLVVYPNSADNSMTSKTGSLNL